MEETNTKGRRSHRSSLTTEERIAKKEQELRDLRAKLRQEKALSKLQAEVDRLGEENARLKAAAADSVGQRVREVIGGGDDDDDDLDTAIEMLRYCALQLCKDGSGKIKCKQAGKEIVELERPKLDARSFSARERIKQCVDGVDEFCRREFGVAYVTGAGKRGRRSKSVETLKTESYKKTQELADTGLRRAEQGVRHVTGVRRRRIDPAVNARPTTNSPATDTPRRPAYPGMPKTIGGRPGSGHDGLGLG